MTSKELEKYLDKKVKIVFTDGDTATGILHKEGGYKKRFALHFYYNQRFLTFPIGLVWKIEVIDNDTRI